jgi:NTE family protein
MASNGKRPVVGIALGGGVARGMAHVGVLRELEKNDIPIDLIAGTSAGALAGACYAAGMTPDQIEELACNMSWSDLGRVTVSRLGFYNSERTESFLKKTLPVSRFEQTRIPLGIVATDLQAGKMVVFTEGDIPLAVRASCAIPCYFIPVMVNGRMMVDGGVVGHLRARHGRRHCHCRRRQLRRAPDSAAHQHLYDYVAIAFDYGAQLGDVFVSGRRFDRAPARRRFQHR